MWPRAYDLGKGSKGMGMLRGGHVRSAVDDATHPGHRPDRPVPPVLAARGIRSEGNGIFAAANTMNVVVGHVLSAEGAPTTNSAPTTSRGGMTPRPAGANSFQELERLARRRYPQLAA